MKTVFDNKQCAHIWAQRSQPFGRSNSMEFDGAMIKSYQTPIAAFVPVGKAPRGCSPIYQLKDGARVVFISENGYSATTRGRHLPAVRQAVRHRDVVFIVPDVGYGGGWTSTARTGVASDPKAWKPVHAVNLPHLVKSYRELVASALRSRRGIDVAASQNQLSDIEQAAKHVARYCDIFGLKLPKGAKIDGRADAEVVARRNIELRAKADASQTPAAIAKREKAAEARAARLAARDAEKLDRWRHFEGPAPDSEYAYLRFSQEYLRFETSQGAHVELEDARKFFKFYSDVMKNSGGYGWVATPCPDGTFRVGPFPLRRIDSNGDVQIGCHKIRASEIEAHRARLQG